MSVIATYARLGSDSIGRCRSNPQWMDELHASTLPGAEVIDIDKACDGLVWLLSRMPLPLDGKPKDVVSIVQQSLAPLLQGEGGASEPRLEAPYGPASALSTQQVTDLSMWLQSLDEARVRSCYDPRAMAADRVYPQIWMKEGAAACDEYLLPALRELRDFFARAHKAGQQVLVFFT